jgi:hypothetical protein
MKILLVSLLLISMAQVCHVSALRPKKVKDDCLRVWIDDKPNFAVTVCPSYFPVKT